jgi:putative Holliday junction resolvase
MPLINLAALPPGRLLGLDPGAKRIGVALSDVMRRIASPYGTLARAKLGQNAAEISAIAAREGAMALVIGWAVDEEGAGRRAQAARDWAHALSAATGLPALLQDESFTTADAHERMIEAGLSRERRAALVDKMAAAAILQHVLDRLATAMSDDD